MEKKFTKENETFAEEGNATQGENVLRSRIRALEDELALKERGTGKARIKYDKPPGRSLLRRSTSLKIVSRCSSCVADG